MSDEMNEVSSASLGSGLAVENAPQAEATPQAEAAPPLAVVRPKAPARKSAAKTSARKASAAAGTVAPAQSTPAQSTPEQSTPEVDTASQSQNSADNEQQTEPPTVKVEENISAPAVEAADSRAEKTDHNREHHGGPAPEHRSGNPNQGQQNNGHQSGHNQSGDDRNQDNRGLRFRGREGRVEGRRGRGRGRLRGEQRDGDLERDGEFAGGRRNEFDMVGLEEKNLTELREIAKRFEIASAATLKKSELVTRILEGQAIASGHHFKSGQLEIVSDGKGFLRTDGYLPGNADVYVSQTQITRNNLKNGDWVSGQVRAPTEMERYWGLLRVEAINGASVEAMKSRKDFEKLTPIFPNEKFHLETTQENLTARIIDLVTPIGKGQRGLIVAPPKAGKTSLIKNIANSIMANHPDVMLIVLLIDERPEEVTDISRSVKGEVVASTFDELPENHIRVADMVLEKAKRLVEMKNDVVILLDSITRLSRASNLVVTPSGRTMSGGLDPAAMYKPKRLFGAARNIEEGGSLTILATVLVDTGSRMDEYIFEELKGTGNLDLVLDRDLFNQRIFPSIDINKSGTRRDDLLLSKEDLAGVFHLRRTLSALDNDKAITLLLDRLKNTKSNADFMQIVQKSSLKDGGQ
jgi:transcription termination factor Rho